MTELQTAALFGVLAIAGIALLAWALIAYLTPVKSVTVERVHVPETTKRPRETHSIKLGSKIFIASAQAKSPELVFCGWDQRAMRWEAGDFFIVIRDSVHQPNTRYVIERIQSRPEDWFFIAACRFAPRGA